MTEIEQRRSALLVGPPKLKLGSTMECPRDSVSSTLVTVKSSRRKLSNKLYKSLQDLGVGLVGGFVVRFVVGFAESSRYESAANRADPVEKCVEKSVEKSDRSQ